MSKVIYMKVERCLECPNCAKSGRSPVPYRIVRKGLTCALAVKRIGNKEDVTEDTPIPEWCPLPDEGSQE